jgi:tetratricopeptide (TPR) repeat protein
MGFWSAVTAARVGRVTSGLIFGGGSVSSLVMVRRNGGAYVGVKDYGPSFWAGMRRGDLVIEVNGQRVADHPAALYGPMLWGKPGDTLEVVYARSVDRDAAAEQARAIERLNAYEGARAWAELWRAAEDTTRAIEAMRRAAALDTSSTQQAARDLGAMLNRFWRGHEALPVYAAVLERNPRDRMALYLFGETLMWMSADLDSAAACFRHYLETPPERGQPSLAWAHHNLGLVYSKQGKRVEAVTEFRRAVELEPFTSEFTSRLLEEERRR